MEDDLDAWYELTQDIDCSATVDWNEGAGFDPIGNTGSPFIGILFGREHAIDGLYISQVGQPHVGLFGLLGNGSSIYRLSLTDANIAGPYEYTGVFAGEMAPGSSAIEVSATGSLVGGWWAGGLVGKNSGYLENTYADVDVSSTASRVGGLVGENAAVLYTSYSRGAINAGPARGGLVGYAASGTAAGSFWDTETSGQATSAAGTGKTSAQMKTMSTFVNMTTPGLDAAWDFVGTFNDDNENGDIWMMDSGFNSGYPFYTWQEIEADPEPQPDPIEFESGDGSLDTPYVIANCEQLQGINFDPELASKNYVLGDDIDCSMTHPMDDDFNGEDGYWADGEGFQPILDFTGEFDGAGNDIDGIYINRANGDNQALFETLSNGSFVHDINFPSPSVQGNASCGVVAGVIFGSVVIDDINISEANVLCSITGAGGIAGTVETSDQGDVEIYDSEVEISFNPNQENEANNWGGLVGYINLGNGKLIMEENQAVVQADEDFAEGVAGLIGGGEIYNGGAIDISHNATMVEYDMCASGCSGLIGGVTSEYDELNEGSEPEITISDNSVEGYMGVGSDSGGLIGTAEGNGLITNITDSYFSGQISGIFPNVGGLVGSYEEENSTLNVSQSLAIVEIEAQPESPSFAYGGLVAYTSATTTINNSYFDGVAMSWAEGAGGLGWY